MAISRRDLMKELMPGLNAIFDEVYTQHLSNYNRIEMPRQGRYQVWQGTKMVADRIKHRREALAVMKLLKENQDGTS
jgi:hypothetical protein